MQTDPAPEDIYDIPPDEEDFTEGMDNFFGQNFDVWAPLRRVNNYLHTIHTCGRGACATKSEPNKWLVFT